MAIEKINKRLLEETRKEMAELYAHQLLDLLKSKIPMSYCPKNLM